MRALRQRPNYGERIREAIHWIRRQLNAGSDIVDRRVGGRIPGQPHMEAVASQVDDQPGGPDAIVEGQHPGWFPHLFDSRDGLCGLQSLGCASSWRRPSDESAPLLTPEPLALG